MDESHDSSVLTSERACLHTHTHTHTHTHIHIYIYIHNIHSDISIIQKESVRERASERDVWRENIHTTHTHTRRVYTTSEREPDTRTHTHTHTYTHTHTHTHTFGQFDEFLQLALSLQSSLRKYFEFCAYTHTHTHTHVYM